MTARQRLLADPSLLSGLIEATMDAIVIIDDRMRIILLNPTAHMMFGYKPGEVEGKSLEHLLPSRFRASHADHVRKFGQGTVSNRKMGALGSVVGLRKDGEEFPIEASISKVTVGAHNFYTAILRDISERRQHELRIARLTHIHVVLSGINNAIIRIHDPQALFNETCRIAVEVGEFPMVWIGAYDKIKKEIDAVAWHGIEDSKMSFTPSKRKALPLGLDMAGRLYRTKKPVVVNDIEADPHIGGAWRNEAIKKGLFSVIGLPLMLDNIFVGTLVMYAKGKNYFDLEEVDLLSELANDISFALSYIENQKKINYLAYYDSLTGLPNREMFLDRLASYIDVESHYGHRVAVLIMDIDRFKSINDTLGRHGGDELLKQIAARFELSTNEKQIRHARLGADAFAIVIPDAKNQDEVVQRIRFKLQHYFNSPFKVSGGELMLSAKFGAALFPDDGADAETLFKNAEAALKKAKASGEPYLFYSSHMNSHVAERLSMENKLLQAIKNEEFVLHYQPKVTLDTRRIVGVEALVRWKDPENGLVPPVQFIPLLEETGLILEVGPWLLRRAIQDYESWLKTGLAAPRIAVNVSAIQLRQSDFIEDLQRAITTGSRPTGIDIELTESFLMEDIEGNIAKILAIREMGSNISVDDFGTGYSSLAYLARLPVQVLKIDRSFIIRMLEDPSAMTLVSTIISLAHSLQLKVVAEGVETEEQAKMLRLLRCDEMQGYLFSQPLSFEAMSELLKHAT